LMRFAMNQLLGVRIPLRLEALPALLLTLLGVCGFGFIIAGAMLIFKQVESFSNLMTNGLAFLNGAFLPVSAMPIWMATIAKTLPSTLGIIVIRKIILEGKSLAATWRDGSLVELAVNSVIYFVVGWLVFAVCERIAKNRGSLGQY
jgi:ABC-2 type transport system permease protein